MPQKKSWTVSDEFWEKIESLVPPPPGRATSNDFARKPGGGRKPMPARQAFQAIVYVLRTKIQWNALPRRFGSSSAVHARFKYWEKNGFFHAIWQTGLAEHDGMEGISWEWQSTDNAIVKNPLTDGCVGRNPTSRGKKSKPTQPAQQRIWRPARNRRIRQQGQ